MPRYSLNPFYECRYLFDLADRRVEAIEQLLHAVEEEMGRPAVKVLGDHGHHRAPSNLHEWIKFFLVPSSIRIPGYALKVPFGELFSLLSGWCPTWRTFGLLAHADLRLEGEFAQASADGIYVSLCKAFENGWIVLTESCLSDTIAPELVGRTYFDLYDFKAESNETLIGVPSRFSSSFMNDALDCSLEPMEAYYEKVVLENPLCFLEQFLFTISEPTSLYKASPDARLNHLLSEAIGYCHAAGSAIDTVLVSAPDPILVALPRYVGANPTDGREWLMKLQSKLRGNASQWDLSAYPHP